MANDDKPKLPKRLYYRLSEAAEYLTKNGLECSEADLLHWGATGQIEIIAKIKQGQPIHISIAGELMQPSYQSRKILIQAYFMDFFTCKPHYLADIEFFCKAIALEADVCYKLESGGWFASPKLFAIDAVEHGILTIEILNRRDEDTGNRYLIKENESISACWVFSDTHAIDYEIEASDLYLTNDEVDRLINQPVPTKQQSESKPQTNEELLAEYHTRTNAGEKGVVTNMAVARGCSTQRIYALVNKAKEKNKPNAFDNLYKRN